MTSLCPECGGELRTVDDGHLWIDACGEVADDFDPYVACVNCGWVSKEEATQDRDGIDSIDF